MKKRNQYSAEFKTQVVVDSFNSRISSFDQPETLDLREWVCDTGRCCSGHGRRVSSIDHNDQNGGAIVNGYVIGEGLIDNAKGAFEDYVSRVLPLIRN